LGFNWPAWFEVINANPRLRSALAYAYLSFPMQISVLIFYFSYADPKRVHELLLAVMLSVIFIVPIMVLLPAVGAWSQYGVGMVEPWRHDILALRAHTLVTIGETKGIVSFPSFHTALAVLFIYIARGRKWFLPVLILNLLMIASVPTEGAHYGVDVVSGLAVALMALATTQFVLARSSRHVAAVAEGTYKFAAGYPWAIQQSVPIECLRENMPNNEAPLSTSNQALTELQAGES
jgi:membrane-associated phospholipid phosphatase